jgi:hypothetical protein
MRDKIKFEFADIVNPDEAISYYPEKDKDGKERPSFNPHNLHAFVLHDAGFTVCVVWASNLQDALDEAVDKGKLDRFQVSESELTDYVTGKDSEGFDEYSGISFLGNASEPFDIEPLDVVEMTNAEFFSQLSVITFEC